MNLQPDSLALCKDLKQGEADRLALLTGDSDFHESCHHEVPSSRGSAEGVTAAGQEVVLHCKTSDKTKIQSQKLSVSNFSFCID